MALRAVSLLIYLALLVGCSESGSGKSGTSGTPASTQGSRASVEGTAIELTPVPEGFPLGLSASEGFALHLFESPSASQGYKKFPAETADKRYYDEFTLAGTTHLVITEASTPPKIYFDENRNGDLTDDRPPAVGEKPGLFPNHYTFMVRYPQEKVIVPYRFWAFGSNMGGVRFYPVCHWSGTLSVSGNAYPVVAFDGNSDGDYSNDPVVVDVNGNGKADEGEKLLPGAEVTVEGTPVRLISISPSGLTVRFKL